MARAASNPTTVPSSDKSRGPVFPNPGRFRNPSENQKAERGRILWRNPTVRKRGGGGEDIGALKFPYLLHSEEGERKYGKGFSSLIRFSVFLVGG